MRQDHENSEGTHRGDEVAAPVGLRRRGVFEDRYGAGAYVRLTSILKQPCVSFAQIATEFGVTRERVRQWHLELLPGAPRGHERRRLCREYQQKRRLLADPLFQAFYRHVRAYRLHGRLGLVPAAGVFRTRMVRLDDRVVALRDLVSSLGLDGGAASAGRSLPRYRGGADFVYFRLTSSDFVFVPADLLRAGIETSTARGAPAGFRNTFAAIDFTDSRASAPMPDATGTSG